MYHRRCVWNRQHCDRRSGKWDLKKLIDGSRRSYTWVKQRLQETGLVKKAPGWGKHCKRRNRPPLPGMLIHQNGSTNEWVPGCKWIWLRCTCNLNSPCFKKIFLIAYTKLVWKQASKRPLKNASRCEWDSSSRKAIPPWQDQPQEYSEYFEDSDKS